MSDTDLSFCLMVCALRNIIAHRERQHRRRTELRQKLIHLMEMRLRGELA